MLKQLLLTAALAAGTLAASAKDYTVYNNGQLSPNIQAYGWWHQYMDFTAANPDGEGLVFEFKAADGGDAASMGLNLEGEPYTGPLHSATLNFSWYAKGTGTYTIRLTSVAEENYTFVVTEADLNKWNTVSLNVAEKFPNVAKQWNDFEKAGVGYVFSVVLENGTADSDIYFNNIYYSNIDENWTKPAVAETPVPTTVPTPTHPAADVISIYGSAYPQATTFGIGGWGQSTQATPMSINGKDVYKVEYFNYLGWELAQHLDITSMTHMHVDFWTPTDGAAFGFTPISPGAEKPYVAPEVKKEEWNSYDVALTHWDNVNFADLFQIKFDQGNGQVTGYITNVYFYKEGQQGGEDPDPVEPGSPKTYNGKIESSVDQTMEGQETKTYPYTINYSITWNEDKTLTLKATYDWANGEPVGIIPGSAQFNNGGLKDLTADGAVLTITTEATFEEGQTIPVHLYRPMALGVVEDVFNYTVGSESEEQGGGEDPEPDPEPKPEPQPGASYSDSVNGTVNQEGTDYPYTLDYSIVYNEDKTLTVTANLVWIQRAEPFGFVEGSVIINDKWSNFAFVNGVRTVTTAETYEAGVVVPVRFYIAGGAGAVVETNNFDYTVGSSKSTNGITAPVVSNGAVTIYDLQGRRVAAPAHGIYIVNGKKVLF